MNAAANRSVITGQDGSERRDGSTIQGGSAVERESHVTGVHSQIRAASVGSKGGSELRGAAGRSAEGGSKGASVVGGKGG
eukprot:840-Rhodomonas_salina.1